jgi:uncharacterized protein YceK
MKLFKFIVLLIMVSVLLTGCFAAQRDAINQEANERLHSLDSQCKYNMTDWCLVQYQIILNDRDRALNDVSTRQANFTKSISEGMQKFGDSFSGLGQ